MQQDLECLKNGGGFQQNNWNGYQQNESSGYRRGYQQSNEGGRSGYFQYNNTPPVPPLSQVWALCAEMFL